MGLAQSLRSGSKEVPEDNRAHPDALPLGSHGFRAPPEVQVLRQHTNIVRHLVSLGSGLLASGSDDATIVIWDTSTGEPVHVLTEHDTRYNITCLLHLPKSRLLVSGSSDRTIKLWNYTAGTCVKTLNFHDGSVVCLQRLLDGGFCSGANDAALGIWSETGDLVGRLPRKEEENLHCLLPISRDRVATGSNSSLILVYSLPQLRFVRLLAAHRESVRCLIRIDDDRFASASMDGLICIWSSEELAPLTTLNFHNHWFDKELRAYLFPVWDMCILAEPYIAAAVGNGFVVYNYVTKKLVASRKHAHKTSVVKILALANGSKLCTCAADGVIRVWAIETSGSGDGGRSEGKRGSKGRRKSESPASPNTSVCVASMTAHTDGVTSLTALTDASFASCGADGLVVLWKDGDAQMDLRAHYATMSLIRDNACPRPSPPIPGTPSSAFNTSTMSSRRGERSSQRRSRQPMPRGVRHPRGHSPNASGSSSWRDGKSQRSERGRSRTLERQSTDESANGAVTDSEALKSI